MARHFGRVKICFYGSEDCGREQIWKTGYRVSGIGYRAQSLENCARNSRGVMDRILLSGASGMLGTALSAALGARYERLRLVRRAPVRVGEIEWHPEAVRPVAQMDWLEGLSAAIHLSGANVAGRRWTAAYKRELVESRVGSTRALALALAALREKPQVLLVASGTGFYGNRGDEILDESSSVGSGFLAELCRDWEEAAKPAADAGIRVVHLRFGLVMGKGGALKKMLPAFRLGLGGPLGDGTQWMSWIALEDLVNAVWLALMDTSLAGPVNVVAPNPVTNAEFARALGRVLHRPAVLPAPAFALRLAFGEMADEALLAGQRVVPKKLLDAGFRFEFPEIEGALRAAIM